MSSVSTKLLICISNIMSGNIKQMHNSSISWVTVDCSLCGDVCMQLAYPFYLLAYWSSSDIRGNERIIKILTSMQVFFFIFLEVGSMEFKLNLFWYWSGCKQQLLRGASQRQNLYCGHGVLQAQQKLLAGQTGCSCCGRRGECRRNLEKLWKMTLRQPQWDSGKAFSDSGE